MRISDWSSDVCSSDLAPPKATPATAAPRLLVAGRRADRMRGVAVVAVSRPGRARPADPIDKASCRDRWCRYVSITVGAVSLTIQDTFTHVLKQLASTD